MLQETIVNLDTGLASPMAAVVEPKHEVRFSNHSAHSVHSHEMQMKALFTRPGGTKMFGLSTDKGLNKAFSTAMHNVGDKDVIDRHSRFSFSQVFKLTSLEKNMAKSFSVTGVLVTSLVLKILEMHGLVDLKPYMWLAENKSVLSTIGLFLSFFLTYFVGQCVSRYYSLYYKALTIVGRCFNLALLSASYLDEMKTDRMWRYANVAHMAMYNGIMKSSGCGDNWWTGIVVPRISSYKLLTEQEVGMICPPRSVPSGGRIVRSLMLWCERIVATAVSEDGLPGEIAARFHAEIRDFRGCAADVGDIFDRPLPMMYLTVVLKTVYVYFVFTVMFATLSDRLFDCCLVIAFSAYQLFGLLIIARAMESPFGVEEDDLPTIDWVDLALEESLDMICLPMFPGGEADSEGGQSPVYRTLSGKKAAQGCSLSPRSKVALMRASPSDATTSVTSVQSPLAITIVATSSNRSNKEQRDDTFCLAV